MVNNNLEFLTALKGKKVLLTGHTGFKGSWLLVWLRKLGAEVCGYALPPYQPEDLFQKLALNRFCHHNEGDIRDFQQLNKVFNDFKPEIVIHLAAQALVRRAYDEPKYTYDTNAGGAINILEAVRTNKSVKSLVFITSDKCYANKEWIWGYRENDELGGHDPYSASKAAAELIFDSYRESFFKGCDNLGVATARAGNVIGGGDWSEHRIVPDCVKALTEKKPIILRNPNATRPWQHVLEPLSGYLTLAVKLLESPASYSGNWNFGPNSSSIHTVEDLARKMLNYWGSGEIEIRQDPNAPFESGLLALNCDKAEHLLRWSPKWNFDTTIKHIISCYQVYLKQKKNDVISEMERQITEYSEQAND